MKFLVILVVAGLIQAAFLPINLVLILLICWVVISGDRWSLLVGLMSGIFLAYLNLVNLGLYGLLFLVFVKLAQIYRTSPFSTNVLTTVVFTTLMLLLFELSQLVLLGIKLDPVRLIWEFILCFPTYFGLLFWQERFIFPGSRSLILKKGLR